MQEVDVGFGKRFSPNPRFELSTGLHYSLKNIDAPGDARLPTSLHRVAVNMGGSYRLNDNLTLGLMASPGLNSDFKVITSSDIPRTYWPACSLSSLPAADPDRRPDVHDRKS